MYCSSYGSIGKQEYSYHDADKLYRWCEQVTDKKEHGPETGPHDTVVKYFFPFGLLFPV